MKFFYLVRLFLVPLSPHTHTHTHTHTHIYIYIYIICLVNSNSQNDKRTSLPENHECVKLIATFYLFTLNIYCKQRLLLLLKIKYLKIPLANVVRL